MSRAATSTGVDRRPTTSTRPEPGRRPRRPARAPGFYRRLALAGLVAVLLAPGGWVVWVSPLLGVKTVRVEGTSVLREVTVRDAADIATDTPLARIDLQAVRLRVGQLAPVASAVVSRSWPNTVVIRVVERQPVLTVMRQSVPWVLDRTGTVYLRVVDLPGSSVPKGVLPLDTPRPGPKDAATADALAVLQAIPRSLRALVTAVRAPVPALVTLELADGRRVVWGGPDDSALKSRLIGPLLQQPGTEYDVSTPTAVVIR